MDLVKDLPEVFEEFAEQRKQSFLKVKEVKENGVPVVGVFCTYFPHELAIAAEAVVVSLCSTSDETIPDAERVLPKTLCPLIKSSYGFAITEKCPFFYFSDLVVGETTCDGKKKMFEYMGEIKPVHVMHLPDKQDEQSLLLWKTEVKKMADVLSEKFGVEITEEKLRKAVYYRNEERKALKQFYELMKMNPAPMTGEELFNVLYGNTFQLDVIPDAKRIYDLTEKIKAEYEEKKDSLQKKPRILITGCPIGGATVKVIRAVEENGGVVVTYENCNGAKQIDELVDESNPDVYDAIARRYLNIGCSVMSPNPNRKVLLKKLCEEYQVDGVLEMVLQACHTYNVESYSIGKYVREELGIPYMSVETDYSQSDKGQLSTRVAAFIEML